MKRDCGRGELIPVKFNVVYCLTKADDETEEFFSCLEDAVARWEFILPLLKPCSNVRLYAMDKQKYANCILSRMVLFDGRVFDTDRRGEL